MKRWLLYIILCLPLSLSSQTVNEMLARPTDQSITMNMLFDQVVEVYFEYGTQSGVYSNQTSIITSISGEPVIYKIDGLEADTRYYYRTRYRLIGDSDFLAGDEHTFMTQRAKGSSFTFTIEADPHPYDKKCYAPLWDIALQNQLNDNPDFMFDMGDTFGDDHNPFTITDAEIKTLHLNVRDFLGKASHSVPFLFCVGNHEGESGYYLLQTPPNNLATYGTIWRKYYYPNPFPDGFYTGNQELEANGIGAPENYYAFEWGDALFVVLDAWRYYTVNAKPRGWEWTLGQTQFAWMKQTLETSNAKYKFVFIHHVMGETRGGAAVANLAEWGSTATKGDNLFETNRPGWGGKPVQQIMEETGVDILFQGHDHIYAKEQVGNVIYQTCPMPSDSSYQIGVVDNSDAFTPGSFIDGSGHIRVTVSPDSARVDYVSAVLPQDETASLRNAQVRSYYTIYPNTSAFNETKQIQSWNLYPNPSDGDININLPEAPSADLMLNLYNMDGTVIDQVKASSLLSGDKQFHWNLREKGLNLPAGLYLISLSSNNVSYERKLLILK